MTSYTDPDTKPESELRVEVRVFEPIRDYILKSIRDGAFKAGDQLPTERVLSEEFNCPRSVVRKALTVLELEGKIVRNVGRGTFVAPSAAVTADAAPLVRPAATYSGAGPTELMEARMLVEPNVAELAVKHATFADIRDIEAFHLKANDEATAFTFDWDEHFHRAIAKATHNNLVISVFEEINRERLNPEWNELKLKRHDARPHRRAEVSIEHAAIVDAIRERDGEKARLAMIEHLLGVRRHLFGY